MECIIRTNVIMVGRGPVRKQGFKFKASGLRVWGFQGPLRKKGFKITGFGVQEVEGSGFRVDPESPRLQFGCLGLATAPSL